MKLDLNTKPSRFRSTIARGLKTGSKIDRKGGDYGAGIVPGMAVITRGEALGHDVWIDAAFLQQTADAINATGETGAKARFTHPDMSGDGLGSLLGKAKNASVVGDKVVADLHMLESAHKTPDGDLAGYVMDLADEAPDSFGESISFLPDMNAQAEFIIANGGEVSRSGWIDTDSFKSPDELNTGNLPHARLAELYAVDTVDEPAANPDGLFARTNIPAEADLVLSYALGLSDARPTVTALSVDPERAKGFATRWLARNGLELRAKETTTMSDKTETPPADKSSFLAELNRFNAKFGTENGNKWLADGKTYEQALDLHCDALTAKLAAKDTEIADLNTKLAAAKLGHQGDDKVESNPQKQPGQKAGLGIGLPSGRKTASAT